MKRMLIVEDDNALKEELAILLKRNGYVPVSQEPCDLVFSGCEPYWRELICLL